ncbi:MAG: hypothetical protein ACFFCW_04505 [Candidatus Hodarchaeota archaeon]
MSINQQNRKCRICDEPVLGMDGRARRNGICNNCREELWRDKIPIPEENGPLKELIIQQIRDEKRTEHKTVSKERAEKLDKRGRIIRRTKK